METLFTGAMHGFAESLPAERDARLFTYRTPIDAHEPTRHWAHGYAVSHKTPNGDPRAMVIDSADFAKLGARRLADLRSAVFIIDDGKSAVPHYVAGWRADTPAYLFLHPLPTNPNGATRPDGRTIDYADWFVSARTCYHLRVSAVAAD